MLFQSNIYNLYSISKEYINYLHYDKCVDNDLVNKLVLISKINCTTSVDLVNKLSNILSKLCKKIVTKSPGVNVVLDNTLKFYSENLDCVPLSLWKIVAQKIEFKYNVVSTIKSVEKEKEILTFIKNNNISSEYINPVIKTNISKINIKNKNSENKTDYTNFDHKLELVKELKNKASNLDIKIKFKDNKIHLIDKINKQS